jgi:integron integrase
MALLLDVRREGATMGGMANELDAPQPAEGGRPPRLLDQVRWAIRLRRYSRRTEDAYVNWIRRFILYHGKRHPAEMSDVEVTAFLSHLAVCRRVSASTQNQAMSAILFLYRVVLKQELPWMSGIARAKRPVRLPVVLTRAEVKQVFALLGATTRLPAMLLYGSGLRLMECLRLRIKDVDLDLDGRRIIVRGGKGQKDRVTILPAIAVEPLRRQIEAVRRQHARDLKRDAGWVELPDAIERKSPAAGRELAWQWLFPARRQYIAEENGQRRRHHLHQSVLQRAVRDAVRRAGITKPASCHTFRHSFATHLLEDRCDIRMLQKLLGHKNVSTTMLYTHVMADRLKEVQSPADRLFGPDPSSTAGPGA